MLKVSSGTGFNLLRRTDGKCPCCSVAGNALGKCQFVVDISKKLEDSFEVANWKDLKECLILNDYEDKVPLPKNPPYLKGDTLMFVYQQYEIAAYAYGLPVAAIPLKDLKGMLSPSFVKTLNGQ